MFVNKLIFIDCSIANRKLCFLFFSGVLHGKSPDFPAKIIRCGCKSSYVIQPRDRSPDPLRCAEWTFSSAGTTFDPLRSIRFRFFTFNDPEALRFSYIHSNGIDVDFLKWKLPNPSFTHWRRLYYDKNVAENAAHRDKSWKKGSEIFISAAWLEWGLHDHEHVQNDCSGIVTNNNRDKVVKRV